MQIFIFLFVFVFFLFSLISIFLIKNKKCTISSHKAIQNKDKETSKVPSFFFFFDKSPKYQIYLHISIIFLFLIGKCFFLFFVHIKTRILEPPITASHSFTSWNLSIYLHRYNNTWEYTKNNSMTGTFLSLLPQTL